MSGRKKGENMERFFRINATDGVDSECRRRGRSKHDVCDWNAKSCLPDEKEIR